MSNRYRFENFPFKVETLGAKPSKRYVYVEGVQGVYITHTKNSVRSPKLLPH